MLRSRLALCLLLISPLVLVGAEPEKPPFRYTEGKHGTGELKFVNELPVLVVEGTPAEIGDAVGKLAMAPGKRAMAYPKELMNLFGAERFWPLVVTLGKGMYTTQFPAASKQELEALSKASGVDLDTLIVGNTIFDLKKFFACSGVLVEAGKSKTGAPLLGRNLDYPPLGYVHHYTLVTVYKPKGKHAFAAVGFPGLVGCLSGMNDAGLAVAILEVVEVKPGERPFNAEAVPYAINYRRLLEDCTTIDEAFKALQGMKRTSLNNLIVADKTGVAVFEVSPDKVVKRTSIDGLAICTNHFCDVGLAPEKPDNVAYTLDRFNALSRVREVKDKVGVEELHHHLHQAHLGELTLQTMVFEPATLKLHLAYGKTPSSAGPLRTLELKELLQGRR